MYIYIYRYIYIYIYKSPVLTLKRILYEQNSCRKAKVSSISSVERVWRQYYSFAEERVASVYSVSGHGRLMSLWALSALLKDILQLQHAETHCKHYNTQQHTATHFRWALSPLLKDILRTATHCNTLQHPVIYCNHEKLLSLWISYFMRALSPWGFELLSTSGSSCCSVLQCFDDDDCFNYFQQYFSTLDLGSMWFKSMEIWVLGF